MTNLPAKAELTNTAGTFSEANFRAGLDKLIDYLSELAGGGSSAALNHVGTVLAQAAAAGDKPLTVKAAASQTANLIEIQNSAGAVLARVDNAGKLYTPTGGMIVGATQLVVTDAGRIGIGTAAPGYDVHVVRSGADVHAAMFLETAKGSFRIHVSGTATGSGPVTVEASSSVTFKTGGTEAWALDGSANSNFFNKRIMNAKLQASDNTFVGHRTGTTAPDSPTIAAMITGELFLDLTAGLSYAKKSDGTVIAVGGGGSGGGGSYLPLTGGTLSGALSIVSAGSEMTIRESSASAALSRLRMRHLADTLARIEAHTDASISGTVTLDLGITYENAAAVNNSQIRFFRYTKSTGTKKIFFMLGDGTSVSVGGIEILPTEIQAFGQWNIPALKTEGTFSSPFQIGTRRIWLNSGVLLYKDSAPANATDGQPLVPSADYLMPTFVTSVGVTAVAVPTGARGVYAILLGGGGAGGGVKSTAANSFGGGGGGGAYLEAFLDNLPGGSSLSCTVGAGGAASSGANGGAGQDTKIAISGTTYMTAAGGNGGVAPNSGSGAGGSGGLGTVSNGAAASLALQGSAGKVSSGSAGGYGGRAGGLTSPNGYEGWGSTVAGAGEAASGFGHGGAGAVNGGSASNRSGGAGAPGYIALMWI